MSVQTKAKSEAKQRGRKASILKQLPPEAAALAINEHALDVVLRGLDLQGQMRKRVPNSSTGVPTLERLMRDDVALTQIKVPEAGQIELKPVLRAETLEMRLMKAGFSKTAAWVADRFARDVEAMTIGRLTASYGEGLGRSTASEPERLLVAMQRVHRATEKLNRQERTAVWGVVVFGLNVTDIGWALAGHRFGEAGRARLADAGWLFLDAALERMTRFYQAVGE